VSSCLVAMYHYVRDTAGTPFPHLRALPPELFERQLDWLQANYTVVDLPALEDAVDGRASLPRGAALLTFDDGFVDHHEVVFPILRARGLSGVFFLAQDACSEAPRLLGVHKTQFLLAALGGEAFGRAVLDECCATWATAGGTWRDVYGTDGWDHADERAVKQLLNYELPFEESDRILDTLFLRHLGDVDTFARRLYLSPAQVCAMAAHGMYFGHHTRRHRVLSRLSVDEQRNELDGGVHWIRSLTGQRRVSFCYPWGSPPTYTADTLQILAESGYSVAFNTVRRCAALNSDARFELPRVDTRDLPPYTAGEREALSTGAADEA
jgi:peptidoglycan/xylan/chitin deacetylase (PgdA/CDA1 family)